jgi:hypothetical protein
VLVVGRWPKAKHAVLGVVDELHGSSRVGPR